MTHCQFEKTSAPFYSYKNGIRILKGEKTGYSKLISSHAKEY
jgi:hypothetical protein